MGMERNVLRISSTLPSQARISTWPMLSINQSIPASEKSSLQPTP